ncbi:hypothetical protein PHYPSEUDO_000890 [Phytophthora pseudosyringae]|uniref:Uncharacterized protein n=1 Tax=Phytophthora pseudosyringae TaxID=221518 RepID=A0A8T1V378_9STRA|nr:hypothetical protein PHYPSEUDO_000890 [Phytophthora pseudosyringae]
MDLRTRAAQKRPLADDEIDDSDGEGSEGSAGDDWPPPSSTSAAESADTTSRTSEGGRQTRVVAPLPQEKVFESWEALDEYLAAYAPGGLCC